MTGVRRRRARARTAPNPPTAGLTGVALVAIGALVAGAGLPACGRPGRVERRPVERSLTSLDDAIEAVNRTRVALLEQVAAVTTAAARLDTADAAGGSGDHRALRRARTAIAGPLRAAAAALRRIDAQATAYADALDRLRTAAAHPALEPAQRSALDAVVAAARVEVERTRTFGRVGLGVWPRFQALDAAQHTWAQRAANGWYRSRDEAVRAYAVMTARDDLAGARRALERADAARAEAAARLERALRQARAALAPLVDPSAAPH